MGRYLIVLLSAVFMLWGCTATPEEQPPSAENIHETLDDWHNAASEADFDRYFSHFASDSAIFMGTDATERWTVAEFKPWSKPYFERGEAWDFTPVERHVHFSDDGRTSWFDESLDTPNLGPARGSGVLTKTGSEWKIVHYNLSIPIPNSIVRDVVRQIEEVHQENSEE